MIPFWNNLTGMFEFPDVPHFLGMTHPAYFNVTGDWIVPYSIFYDIRFLPFGGIFIMCIIIAFIIVMGGHR